MIMTRLKLDLCSPKTVIALNNPNLFHAALEASQGDKAGNRILWRIDSLKGEKYLLIVSRFPLNTSLLEQQFGNSQNPAQFKNYSSFLNHLQEGQIWQFKLTANPTASKKPESRETRGKVYSPVQEEDQIQWLVRKSKANGFQLIEGSTDVVESGWITFQKSNGGAKVSFRKVTFQGLLKITDRDEFCKCLCDGVGKSKAYGMGLLTLVRPHD